MESQNSEMQTSYDEVDVVAEKVESSEIEGEYFLVSNIPENKEKRTPSLSQMCRICASVNDHMIPIFKEEGLDYDLCEKINKHLPIKV